MKEDTAARVANLVSSQYCGADFPVCHLDRLESLPHIPLPPLIERIPELERRIADLKARLPQHSVPPAMLIELEELEEALERAREAAREDTQ